MAPNFSGFPTYFGMFIPHFPLTKLKYKTKTSSKILSLKLIKLFHIAEQKHVVECTASKLNVLLASLSH
jgi:hypothetical protein